MTSAEAPPPMSRKLAGFDDPPILLTGVGDDVEGAHDQPGAVADDADGAVELDVVEVLRLGRGLERVGRGLVLERRVVRVAEVGVLVEGDLAVEGDDLAVLGLDQRVDLDQRGVLVEVDLPQLQHGRRSWRRSRRRSRRPPTISRGLRLVDAGVGVDRRSGRGPRGARPRAARSPCRPPCCTSRGRSGWRGRGAARSSTPRRCRAPSAIITGATVWPLMSMPRICAARAAPPPPATWRP